MKRLLGLLVLVVFLWPSAARAAVALCQISGQVFNPDGTTMNNGTVQFNSQVTQVVGSTTIPPSLISTTTDGSGNMAPMSVAQGLFGTFQFCQGHSGTNVGGPGGGCAAAINGLIPINTTGNIQAVIAGTLLPSVGNATVNNLTVTNNTMVGGTLQVSGLSTLNSLTVTPGATSLTTLNVSGAITGSALITAPSLSVTSTNCGALTFAEAQMTSIPSSQDWIVAAGAHCTGTTGWTADDNSAVLFGNYTYNFGGPGSVSNAGWQWLGDTGLTVGSTYTPTVLMTLADTPAVVSTVNHVGTLSIGSLILDNTNTALTFPGGSIVSVGAANMNYAAGEHYNGSWIADSTMMMQFSEFNGGVPDFVWQVANGLTPGSAISGVTQLGLANANGWTFNGTNPVAIFQSNTNANSDIVEVLPQNQTQGQALLWSGLHSIGGNANVDMNLDAKAGNINLNSQNTGGYVQAFSTLMLVNNHHLISQLNGGPAPSIYSCTVPAGIRGGSTDVSGQVYFGSNGSLTQCLINFGSLWPNAPNCTCSFESGTSLTSACGTNTSTSQVNFELQATVANSTYAQLNYICIGI